jgi:alkaline phosphatase
MKKSALFIVSLVFVIACVAHSGEGESEKKAIAKNIILLIGDGMGTAQIYAGMSVSEQKLNIERFKHIGFSKTYAADNYITDSGAGGTAISIGYKTYSKAIGVDNDTIPRTSILEYAEMNGKATGLVATSTITHATPASFIAHQPARYLYEEIAEDFLKTDIDVFIGGGLKHFNDRKDKKDLTEDLVDKGYHLITDLKDLSTVENGKLAGLIYEDAPPSMLEGRGNMLSVSTNKAIELLNQNKDGFFLMVEGSQIDWGGHDNDIDYITSEMIDFDDVVGHALDFAEKDGNTLVIVTADHETGGLTLVGGNMTDRTIEANFGTGHHSSVMVPVFAYGPGARFFTGINENTSLFDNMMTAFGFSKQENK